MRPTKAFLTLAVLCISSISSAGAVSGGGGMSVVCRDQQSNILSAEVLDLYEARVLKKWPVPDLSTSYMDQVSTALTIVETGREISNPQNIIRTEATRINLIKNVLPPGTGLEPVGDSYHVILPKGCAVEQLANYVDDVNILVDGEIWAKLNETNKAALILHETVYKFMRMYGETTSVRARKVVGAAIAGLYLTPYTDGARQAADVHTCFNKSTGPWDFTKFYAYNDSQGELIFQFASLRGNLMYSKSVAYIDKMTLNDFLKQGKDITYSQIIDSTLEMGRPTAVRVTAAGQLYVDFKSSSSSVPTDEIYCLPGFAP